MSGSGIKPGAYSLIISVLLKGSLSRSKRWPFTFQKTAFCTLKGRLLESAVRRTKHAELT